MLANSIHPILLYLSLLLSFFYLVSINKTKIKALWLMKGLATFLLGGYAFFNCYESIAYFFAISFLFSTLGDIFLSLDEKKFFINGLSSFLIAHIFYAIAFFSQGTNEIMYPQYKPVLVILLLLFSLFMSIKLLPKLGNLKIPVLVYICALMVMGAGAIYTGFSNLILIAGILLFIISDSLLATQKFLKSFVGINYMIWLTYYLGQLLIVFGSIK